MRAYAIVRGSGEGRTVHAYAGSKDACPEIRRNLTEKMGVQLRSFSDEQIEIPTGKDELLAFLNKLVGYA